MNRESIPILFIDSIEVEMVHSLSRLSHPQLFLHCMYIPPHITNRIHLYSRSSGCVSGYYAQSDPMWPIFVTIADALPVDLVSSFCNGRIDFDYLNTEF